MGSHGKPGRTAPQRPHRGQSLGLPTRFPGLPSGCSSAACPCSGRSMAAASKRTSKGNGAPQDPATRRPEPPQSTETVPTPAACSFRATERAVRSGMSRGFCTGRPRRPMWTVTRGSDQALLLPG
jgi:hypothetical protein